MEYTLPNNIKCIEVLLTQHLIIISVVVSILLN